MRLQSHRRGKKTIRSFCVSCSRKNAQHAKMQIKQKKNRRLVPTQTIKRSFTSACFDKVWIIIHQYIYIYNILCCQVRFYVIRISIFIMYNCMTIIIIPGMFTSFNWSFKKPLEIRSDRPNLVAPKAQAEAALANLVRLLSSFQVKLTKSSWQSQLAFFQLSQVRFHSFIHSFSSSFSISWGAFGFAFCECCCCSACLAPGFEDTIFWLLQWGSRVFFVCKKLRPALSRQWRRPGEAARSSVFPSFGEPEACCEAAKKGEKGEKVWVVCRWSAGLGWIRVEPYSRFWRATVKCRSVRERESLEMMAFFSSIFMYFPAELLALVLANPDSLTPWGEHPKKGRGKAKEKASLNSPCWMKDLIGSKVLYETAFPWIIHD